MEGRTARAVQRLKHSPDFTILLEYLQSERDILIKSLIKALTDRDTAKLQGKLLLLDKLINDIEDSEKIARLPQ